MDGARIRMLTGEASHVRRAEDHMDDQLLSQTDVEQQPATVPSLPEAPMQGREKGDVGFAVLLEHLRKERGWSKAELAKRADFDPSSITRLEQGARSPERETVLQLADAMALPMRQRDHLLAAAGFRSELWDDPLLVELSQVLADPSVPAPAREEVRSVVKMAIAYCKLQRLERP